MSDQMTAADWAKQGLAIEARPCKNCVHYRKLFDGSICRKLLMNVTPDMTVCYKIDEGTCFVGNQSPPKPKKP